MNETYLAHYGVKGMKWGVRKDRYHGYKKIKGVKVAGGKFRTVKGTNDYILQADKVRATRITRQKNEVLGSGDAKRRGAVDRTYVNINKKDTDVYRQFYPASLQRSQSKFKAVYLNHLTATSDLTIAGGKTYIKQFDKMYGDNTIKDFYKKHNVIDPLTGSMLDTKGMYKRSPESFDKWYSNKREIFETFNTGMQSEQIQGKLNKQFRDSLKKQGYQGMTDMYSTSNKETKQATIVFDPGKNLKRVGEQQVVFDKADTKRAEKAFTKGKASNDEAVRSIYYNPWAKRDTRSTGRKVAEALLFGRGSQSNITNDSITISEFKKKYPNVYANLEKEGRI